MGIAGPPVQVRNHQARQVQTVNGPYMASKLPVAGFAVIGAILLVTASGGPEIYGFRISDLLGFLLGFSGFILALRSVAMVFGRRT